MRSLALTATDRAKLVQSGSIRPSPAKVAPEPEVATVAACRTWQAALQKARAALEELKEAEIAYIAACDREKGRASRRRMPSIDSYHVCADAAHTAKRSAAA